MPARLNKKLGTPSPVGIFARLLNINVKIKEVNRG